MPSRKMKSAPATARFTAFSNSLDGTHSVYDGEGYGSGRHFQSVATAAAANDLAAILNDVADLTARGGVSASSFSHAELIAAAIARSLGFRAVKQDVE